MNKILVCITVLVFVGCKDKKTEILNAKESVTTVTQHKVAELNLEQANRLALLPLHCAETGIPEQTKSDHC